MSKKKAKKRECPECKGDGYVALLISRPKCTECDGSGWVACQPPEKFSGTGSRALYDMSGRSLSTGEEEETMDDPDYLLEFDDYEEETLWYEALD